MKKICASLMAMGLLAGVLGGCAYGGAAAIGTDKVVVLRNDAFLFGALRKAFVCRVSDSGLASCAANEAP